MILLISSLFEDTPVCNMLIFFGGKVKHDLPLACCPFCLINLLLRTFFNGVIVPFCHAYRSFLTSNYFILPFSKMGELILCTSNLNYK